MSKVDEKVEELKAVIDAAADAEIDLIKRGNYRLSDAIREGSTVTEQGYNWQVGERACTISAAHLAAKARGFA